MEDQKPIRWPRTLPKDCPPLHGLFQDLTREDFAKYCGWQCTAEEIAGQIGVSVERLAAWVRRAYRLDLDTVLNILHQPGLVAIRKAAFDLMLKNGSVSNQQFSRFIPLQMPDTGETEAAVSSLLRMLEPEEDEYREDGEEAE